MLVIIHPAVWTDPGAVQRTAYVEELYIEATGVPFAFSDFEDLNQYLRKRAGAVLDEPPDASQAPEAARPEYAGAPRCDGAGCYRAASRTLVWATEPDLMITNTCARCEPGLRSVATDGGRRVHSIPFPVCTRRSAHARSDRGAAAEWARALVHVKIPASAAPQPCCARCRHALAPAPQAAPPDGGAAEAPGITWLDAAGLGECRGSPHSPRPADIVSLLEGREKESSAA